MALLEIGHLTHRFGGLLALSDFNLSLDGNELVGIIGPNGAGKTTLFNLISGVYRPTKGSISVEGRELVGLAPNRIAALGIARTFQNIRLFKDLSVLDNVRCANYGQAGYGALLALFRLGRCRREEAVIIDRSMELLALFQLDGHAEEPSRNLPYGLQRRLEIARALATRPKLLLLDEPAAGMNPAEIKGLMGLIEWVRKAFNVTILLIEHQMQLVMNLCERLVVLDFGVTIAEGKPHEIRNDARVLAAYLGEEQPA
ncbi:MAG: ABC transporter ATP-binding protein [Syntrophorhabdales bacterium]|jgi:branched-chain amino acid transport system ATP-binding protein